MKKTFVRIAMVVAFVAPLVMVSSAVAAAPNWDISGTWKLSFYSTFFPGGNPYVHDMVVTGDTATGGTPAGGPYVNSWTANLSIDGDSLIINATYLPGSAVYPYSYTATGTISPDGTASGTWTDTTGDSGPWSGGGPVVSTDTIPPTTTASCPIQNGPAAQYCSLSFSAYDNPGGSGVAYTEYSTDGGVSWTTDWPTIFSGPIQLTVLYRSADNAGNVETAQSIAINLTGSLPPGLIQVHILKYLDGAEATAATANNYLFPMTATWSALNIGSGTGNYTLGTNWGGSPHLYGADTSPMLSPANYTTSEITDSTSQVVSTSAACAPGKYLLNGYRTSAVSFVAAASQPLTIVTPVFTGLTSDQYLIVDNSKCPTGGIISGTVYNDLNRNGKRNPAEPGLAGRIIKLKSSGGVIATTVTDASGKYTFQNIAPGIYRVRETHQTGWKRTSKNPKAIVITSNAIVEDVNFGNAVKKKGECEDTDKDDDRDDQHNNYYSNHGKSSYESEENSWERGRSDGHN